MSVLAGYAMRPQLAMAALLLLAIGSSLIFLRGRPGDRERVQVTERGAPEGDSDSVAILPVPAAEPIAAPEAAKPAASAVAQAPKAEAEPKSADSIGSADSEGDSAFDAALAAFKDGRYGEARRQFDEVAARGGGAQAAEAALYAAQSAKNGEGCAVAVSLFDQVATRHPGTRFGYDATWQAASCYETLGDTERAKRSYQALLDDPNYGERAKSSLASLERTEQQPVEVSARKAVAAAHSPAPAATAPPKAGSAAQKSKPGGPPASTAVDAEQTRSNVGRGPLKHASRESSTSSDRDPENFTASSRADEARVRSRFAELHFRARHHVELAVWRIERSAPDLHGPELRKERGNEVVLREVPPHVVLDEALVDLRGELCVELRELAPVRAGVLVVRGVEAVVEEEKVHELAVPASRVIVDRPRIGVHVLLVVEQHDGPQREKRGDAAGEDVEDETLAEAREAPEPGRAARGGSRSKTHTA